MKAGHASAERISAARIAPLHVALVAGTAFALGWVAVVVARAAPGAFALYLEANERKYLAMTGEAGPVTYLVDTRDVAALTAAALADESVLGLEPFRSASSFAIAFTAADAPGIELVAGLPGTLDMQRRHIPMICH